MKLPRLLVAVCIAQLVLTGSCGPGDPPVQGSDLAVLAQYAEGYAQARPGQALVFPRDHGPHPDYSIEWWYLTANLSDPAGNPYGAQWTLFRLAVQPPGSHEPGNAWQSDQVFMAHIAITSLEDHVSFQRYSRGGEYKGVSRAGVKARPFSAWLDDWALQSTGADWLPMEVQARQGEYALHLQLQSGGPLILQGDAGFSQKHPDGGGSFYYSQPFLKTSGELIVDGQKIPVTGQAWLDREWSSQFLQGSQIGWDWFSLHLESGEKLMLFQLRQQPGKNRGKNFLSGSLIAPGGGTTKLDPDQIQLEILEEMVVAGRVLPLHWRLKLPQISRELDIRALHQNQWMDVDFPYWEGAVTVSGKGVENRGQGYMELTGYPARAHLQHHID
jgi:predicted secreted hydrolase